MKYWSLPINHPKNIEYLFNRRDIDRKTECWNWTGTIGLDGYGRVIHNGHNIRIPRLMMAIEGKLALDSKTIFVLHRCDNRRCFNPAHLFLGDYTDNARDMMAKGRGNKAFGSRCGAATLDNLDVSLIRKALALGQGGRSIADIFGVCESTISMIKHQRNWRKAVAA